jgi:pilus assembly protein FimV
MDSTVEMPPASVEALSLEDDDDEEDHTLMVPKSSDIDEQSEDEEMASQLDLAKAYIELGDNENAKTILDEIIAQGNENYRKQAEELIGQIK